MKLIPSSHSESGTNSTAGSQQSSVKNVTINSQQCSHFVRKRRKITSRVWRETKWRPRVLSTYLPPLLRCQNTAGYVSPLRRLHFPWCNSACNNPARLTRVIEIWKNWKIKIKKESWSLVRGRPTCALPAACWSCRTRWRQTPSRRCSSEAPERHKPKLITLGFFRSWKFSFHLFNSDSESISFPLFMKCLVVLDFLSLSRRSFFRRARKFLGINTELIDRHWHFDWSNRI